jgi:serine protease AprX
MIFQEANWINSNIEKISPDLSNLALGWYRPFRFIPGFMQGLLKRLRQNFRRLPVIVQIQGSEDLSCCTADLSKGSDFKVSQELSLIHSFTSKVNAKALAELVQEERVTKVWLDGTVKAILDIAAPVVNAPDAWSNSLTGKGVGVAVIDTGVYPHPDLNGRISAFKDFVNKKTAPYDDHGHGTHVAGDIASDGISSNALYRGPAPGCNIIGIKVLDGSGSGRLSTVIQGIQWCIENKDRHGIRIINLSLGSIPSQSYREDPVCQAVEQAWKQGIVVCAAAGNDGPGSGTIYSPGTDPAVITVGSMNDKNKIDFSGYSVAGYSSRGPTIDNLVKPDVLSPGTNIISLLSPDSTLDRQNRRARVGKEYLALSGTSMAAPVCSGIVALLLEAKSTLTPDEVKNILKESARALPDATDNDQGSGLIDAKKALSMITNKSAG